MMETKLSIRFYSKTAEITKDGGNTVCRETRLPAWL